MRQIALLGGRWRGVAAHVRSQRDLVLSHQYVVGLAKQCQALFYLLTRHLRLLYIHAALELARPVILRANVVYFQ